MNVVALMVEIAACLCEALAEDDQTQTCFCGVLPGATVAEDFFPSCVNDLDDERDGMAWVRMASAYPAMAPGVMVEDPALSAYAGLGVDIEVGILRNIPVPQEGIDESAGLAAVTGQIADMATIRKAISCCAVFERGDYLLGQYAPYGPLGGAVGGSFTVMVHKP